jgi:nitrite transporter NirC
VSDTAAQAAEKATASTRPVPYLTGSVLAGVYVGLAVVLLVSVSAPLAAAGSPFAKLVQAAVFGLALTLVVFAGAELFTGNVMVMAQGVRRGTVRASAAARVSALSLVGNAVGSLVLAGAVHLGGTLHSGAKPGAPAPAIALLTTMVQAKIDATGGQLFVRAVLCNALVCLAIWMAARAATDGAKLMVLWWGLLAFVGSGFEHSVANMTVFSLAAFEGVASWSDLAGNLVWTVPGNIVGGLLVAAAYACTTRRTAATETTGDAVLADPFMPAPRAAVGS